MLRGPGSLRVHDCMDCPATGDLCPHGRSPLESTERSRPGASAEYAGRVKASRCRKPNQEVNQIAETRESKEREMRHPFKEVRTQKVGIEIEGAPKR